MSEVTIRYKGGRIAGMDGSGTKTLLTRGRFCEDDISVQYLRPGGGAAEQYITALYLAFRQASVPMPLELTLPNCTEVTQAFQQMTASNGADIEITLHFDPSSPTITSLRNAFYGCYNLKKIKLTGDLSGVTSYQQLAAYVGTVTKIDCELDFTSVTAANGADFLHYTMNDLTYVRYKPGTLSINQNISQAPALDDDSLVSIANGLNGSASGQAITLHATPKAKLATITGTAAGGVFTKGADGGVTLLDFITNTKGWTVA